MWGWTSQQVHTGHCGAEQDRNGHSPVRHAFGTRILATGRRAHSAEAEALGVELSTMDEVIASSEVLALHARLTAETQHLINTSRGPLVDEEALADSLQAGHLAGAGLDPHGYEPTSMSGCATWRMWCGCLKEDGHSCVSEPRGSLGGPRSAEPGSKPE